MGEKFATACCNCLRCVALLHILQCSASLCALLRFAWPCHARLGFSQFASLALPRAKEGPNHAESSFSLEQRVDCQTGLGMHLIQYSVGLVQANCPRLPNQCEPWQAQAKAPSVQWRAQCFFPVGWSPVLRSYVAMAA